MSDRMLRNRISGSRVWRSYVCLTAGIGVAAATVACAGHPIPSPLIGVQAIAGITTVPARDVATNLLLHVPPNAAPGEKLPTVLYLHGGSHRGNDLRKLESYGIPRLIAEGEIFPSSS
jgi:acetyl esterase/lipase